VMMMMMMTVTVMLWWMNGIRYMIPMTHFNRGCFIRALLYSCPSWEFFYKNESNLYISLWHVLSHTWMLCYKLTKISWLKWVEVNTMFCKKVLYFFYIHCIMGQVGHGTRACSRSHLEQKMSYKSWVSVTLL
jgi:hypothetical protein